ncbi:hypothetical protein GGS23DRAFT_565220 [Durotheca rogersii]|uniref:uncharacterized protein n=1 Tax=Durotheca rogersii TaxID=419775 RepID=UPI0022208259|nr:uncharacterized protein GGS23DRAFT_565220 [Durotheca rogersii]KAI5863755.1 hypothetical protein GGS23DRAFT_565220 [Durotheca rogersii]
MSEAVEKWRKDHGLTQYNMNAMIHGSPKTLVEFWDHIVETCPNRRRQKVIDVCRREFHNFVGRGAWTPEQHDELRRMWELHGNKFSRIGKLINRDPHDVRDRVRNYVVCGDNRRSNPWSEAEEAEFDSITSDALREIRRRRAREAIELEGPDDDYIDWQLVSEQMGRTRSRLQCIQKWKAIAKRRDAVLNGPNKGITLTTRQLIRKARIEATATSHQDRHRIIEAIRACETKSNDRIPWPKIETKMLANRWSRLTLMLVWYRLKLSVPDSDTMPVPEIIDKLTAAYGENGELDFPDEEDLDLDAEILEIGPNIKQNSEPNLVTKTQRRISKANEDDDSASDKDDIESVVDSEVGGDDDDNGNIDSPVMGFTVDRDAASSVDLGFDAQSRNPSPRSPIGGISEGAAADAAANTDIVKESDQESDRDENRDDDGSLSSDTNASRVESIPAH